MASIGKLSPTNGGSVSVSPVTGLRGQAIRARLLLNTGDPYFEGTLRVTMGNFINAPKRVLLDWIIACGRSKEDIRGTANERNTVLGFWDDEGWLNLHFSEMTVRTPAVGLVSVPPVASVTSKAVGQKLSTPTVPTPVSVLRAHRWADLPLGPGVYWWYFAEGNLDSFRVTAFCDVGRLRLRRSQDGKVCLYHGMAKNLAQRIAWHAAQDLTQQALRSGFLSTFRFTLLALNAFDYLAGRQEIDLFMDELSLSWLETTSSAEAEAIELSELKGEYHYPLNIQDNHRAELAAYTPFLRSLRKAYKQRYL
jgi:hypothetical protein